MHLAELLCINFSLQNVTQKLLSWIILCDNAMKIHQ